jgi:hypothetical protein
MKSKKPKKMTLAEENKLRKELGLEPRKRFSVATVKARWKRAAKALPKDQRQRILDLIWARVPFGAIAEREHVDKDAVLGVYELNTYSISALNTETL